MKLLQVAKKKIAKDCDVHSFRHVSFAFTKSGALISAATNRIADCGVVSAYSIHSEEYLIKKLKKIKSIERFGYISIMTVRMTRSEEFGMAKPCRGCEKLMRDYGVSEISYTDETGNIKQL